MGATRRIENTISRWALLGAAAMVACGRPSTGDERAEQGDVPEALARVLLGMQGEHDRIFVGDPPADVLAAVSPLPPGEALGGVIREGGGTLVVEVHDAPEAVLSSNATAMEEAGWERAGTPPMALGGFVSSRQVEGGMWCSESHSLRMSPATRRGVHYVRVRYSTSNPGPTACEDADLRARMGPGRYGLTLPSLQPPTEAEVLPDGGSGSSNRVERAATVESSLAAGELYEHYARQLTRSGWTPTGRASDGEISMGRWSARDDLGNAALGILAVWSVTGEDVYRAWIRLERVGPGR